IHRTRRDRRAAPASRREHRPDGANEVRDDDHEEHPQEHSARLEEPERAEDDRVHERTLPTGVVERQGPRPRVLLAGSFRGSSTHPMSRSFYEWVFRTGAVWNWLAAAGMIVGGDRLRAALGMGPALDPLMSQL